jgi:hypothetical protein
MKTPIRHNRPFSAIFRIFATLVVGLAAVCVVGVTPTAAHAAVADVPSGAAAYQWADQQQVFMPSSTRSLSHWYWYPGIDAVHNDNWAYGPIAGKTSGFAYNDQEHVVARGTNNHLLHWWWINHDKLYVADWGGEAYSDPTTVVWNNEQHIFARAKDGGIFHWWWTPGDAKLHTEEWRGAPFPILGSPTVMAWGTQLHVVARGPDDTLYHWWKDPGATPTFQNWGGEVASDPIALSWDNKQQFFAQDEAGQLFHWWWDPNDALIHTERWGGAPGTFVGAPFGYKFTDSQLHVIARGPNNTLFHWWWIKGESSAHFANWGGQIYSDPVAFVYTNSQLGLVEQHIFAQSATNTLYHIYWGNPTQGPVHQNWGGNVKYPDPTP